MDELKVVLKIVLKIGDVKLVVTMEAATRMFKALIMENPQILTADYCSNKETGGHEIINKIKELKSDKFTIEYLSAVDYLRFCAAGDADAK